MQNGVLLAGVDLGSNSFRLEIGRHQHSEVQRTEYLKETVRLGNGLDAERNLTPEAMQRGWECLARFGERLAGFKLGQVRAVATQTLREARNRDVFLEKASSLLGFQVDVIPGREEARLIYLGVSHLLPQSDERRLVIDIGGRSTELILGQAYEARHMESYRLGSVAWSMKYFATGEFTAAAFKAAEVAAKALLDDALALYHPKAWDIAYGSSGTIGAVADVLAAAGHPATTITREGLDWLLDKLLRAQNSERLKLDGMKDDRRAVIGGGLSVLRALFDLLNIQTLYAAQGALRQGVLYDLLDREADTTDRRSATVRLLSKKFDVDAAQAMRVASTAQHLLANIHDESVHGSRIGRKLGWACELHEIGSHIAHEDYHKHGAYVLDHADAAGFAVPERHRLSQLVLGHRGKLKKLEIDLEEPGFAAQLVCLRLAVILCHARRDPELQGVQLSTQDHSFKLALPKGWALRFPQSAHLINEEVIAWQKTLWSFKPEFA